MTTQKGVSSLKNLFITAKQSQTLERLAFLRAALTEFQTTGALFPTSKWAAAKLCKKISSKHRRGKRIVELGGGDGAVTTIIMDYMIPGDTLLICELSPELMVVLQNRVREHPRYKELASHITFFCGPAQEIEEGTMADAIVCSLPFLNFDLATVQDIFKKIFAMAAPACSMTYYEYIGIRRVSKIISPPARRSRMKQIDSFFKDIHPKMFREKSNEWRNLFPIHVYELELDGSES